MNVLEIGIFIFMADLLTLGCFSTFSNEFMYFLWKYAAHDIIRVLLKPPTHRAPTGYY